MRTKNKNIPKESKYFRSEIQNCPHCGTTLEYCHSVSN
jgi:alkyl hydroperoxide reductase subunit AhpF